jgi:hypothetical protein
MSDPNVEDSKEKFLRAEINNLAERMHRLFQWSVTLMLSLETALFFVRKEAAERGGLPPGSSFPLHRHLWGTTVMLFLAIVFVALHRGLGKLYKQYFVQLYPMKDGVSSSGITAPIVTWKTQWALDLVVVAFPIFDLFIGCANYFSPLHAPNAAPVAVAQSTQGLPLTVTVTVAQPTSSNAQNASPAISAPTPKATPTPFSLDAPTKSTP